MYFVTKPRFKETHVWHPRFAWIPCMRSVYEVTPDHPAEISQAYIPTGKTKKTGKRAFVWLDYYHEYYYGNLSDGESSYWLTVTGFIIHPTRLRE
jgi:hypothetical protein